MITEETLTQQEEPHKRKHVTQIFKAGASSGLYIPKPIAACYGMDKAGTHVVIEGLDAKGILIRNVEDRLI
jgi:hypothetical protein